jgi:hypothetical protein
VLTWPIWTSIAQVMAKRKAVWPRTTKSQKSTQPLFMQVKCNAPLESSQRKLQLCFRLHPDWKSEQKVIGPQNCGNPNRVSFETPLWESRNKKPFGCRCRGEVQRILYERRWWLPPSPGRGVLWVQNRLWFVLALKVFRKLN